MNPVKSKNQVIKNIKNFQKEVTLHLKGKSNDAIDTLVKNISHYRAWYCFFDESSSEVTFAPSKYIGYEGMDASTYDEFNSNGLDGRQTENVLSNWYEIIPENHEDYEYLSEKLREFCAKFGKQPNSLFRINIEIETNAQEDLEHDVVDFILKSYRKLSSENRNFLKARINRI